MPEVSTGIIRLKHAADKVKRGLLIEGHDPSVINEAISAFDNLIKNKMLELALTDEDVVEITLEYNVSNGKIVWNEGTLKITVYKPLEEISATKKEVEELKAKYEELERKLANIRDFLRELVEKSSKLLSEI